MINAIIGVVILIAGVFFMFKGSISLKKRDEHNKKKPMDDSFYPPSSHE